MDRDIIVDYLEDKAAWRQDKAEESPEDYRNQRCAEGLYQLAEYVRGLLDDDERLRELLMLCATESGGGPLDVFMPGQTVDYAVSRFRFDRPDDNCEQFITELIYWGVEDRLDFGMEHDLIHW